LTRDRTPQWLRIEVPLPPRGEGYRLVDLLHRRGARSVTEVEGRVVAHLPLEGADPSDLLAEVRAALHAGTSIAPDALRWHLASEPPAEGWGPDFRVSPRLVITGTPPSGAGRIRILPSHAFGTPGHPTTRRCLVELDTLVSAGDRIVDVGAGSGILSLVAARLGAARVDAIESDPVGCRATRENAAANHLTERIRLHPVHADPAFLDTLAAEDPPVDGAVANLPPDALHPLLPALARLPRPGGWLLLSGVPRADLPALRKALAFLPLVEIRSEVDDGWWSGVSIPTDAEADPLASRDRTPPGSSDRTSASAPRTPGRRRR
jgi:SAM-dependent methyltransferase